MEKGISYQRLRFPLYRFKFNYFHRFDLVPKFPFHVDLETTDACNLRCIMCVHGTTGVSQTGFIDYAFAQKMIDQIARFGAYSIKFNWRGEPALHPGLADLVRYAKQRGLLEVQFNTNGIPYNLEKTRDLILAGLDRIIFSMDGSRKKTYESIRIGASYEKLVENVKRFHRLRAEMNKTTPSIRIQMVKMKDNKDEVAEFKAMWRPFVDEIRISDVTNRGQGQVLSAGDRVAVGRTRCPQPWQRMVVSRDGKVLPCCADWNRMWIIGDANRDDLKTIWRSKKMKQLRQLIRDHKTNDFEPCSSCFAMCSYKWKETSTTERQSRA